MYAPPPPPSLSKAEIDARRERMRAKVRQISDAVKDARPPSRNADTSASPTRPRRTSVRKLVSFNVGRDRSNKEPHRPFDISAPLPSAPPMTSLPAIPQVSAMRATLSAPPSRPLPQPGIKLAIRGDGIRSVSSGTSVLSSSSASSHDSSRIPRRPPRPTDALVLDSPVSGFDAFVKTALPMPPVSQQISRTTSNRSKLSTSSSTSSQTLGQDSRLVQIVKSAKRPARLNEESLRTFRIGGMKAFRRSWNREQQVTGSIDAALKDGPTENATSNADPASVPFQHKALPETPLSIQQTPAGLCEGRPSAVQDVKSPKPERLSTKVAARNTYKARDSVLDEISPLDLSIAQEIKDQALSNFQPVSRTRTHIHLREGSIVTVTPPEVHVWRKRTYLHGPIRLLKPSSLLRKDSVASLEPFQNAVDKIFKNGESISKRKSELAMAEDICTFFLDFGLLDWDYQDDVHVVEGVLDSSESEPDVDSETDCESIVSHESLDITPDAPVILRAPPVNDAESLRVRGISWLDRQRSKRTKAAEQGGGLPTVGQGEESMLGAVLAPWDEYDDADRKAIEVAQTDSKVNDAAAPWIKSAKADDEDSTSAALRRRSQ